VLPRPCQQPPTAQAVGRELGNAQGNAQAAAKTVQGGDHVGFLVGIHAEDDIAEDDLARLRSDLHRPTSWLRGRLATGTAADKTLTMLGNAPITPL